MNRVNVKNILKLQHSILNAFEEQSKKVTSLF